MSITTFLQRTCTQTAVYWASPVEDGYGGKTFDDPEEIKCRWESSTNLIQKGNGEEIVCNAEVYVLEDLDEQGWLYLGELDDLDSNPDNPMEVSGAREIQKFEKLPTLGSTTEFLRKVIL
jgi:hypothetical protein